jgi:uncharacterized DUF497 family protein
MDNCIGFDEMNIQTSGFDWDSGNKRKCTKHGVTVREIEAFFRQERLFVMPDLAHSHAEERYIAYGPSPKGRPMFVAFTFRIINGDTCIRPISARYMHTKEAREYEEKGSTL